MTDEWNGFAVLLTNLIEKYASDLGIEEMPDPKVQLSEIHPAEKCDLGHHAESSSIASRAAA